VLLILFLINCSSPGTNELIKFQGEAQGTYYAVSYYDDQQRNLQVEIEELLKNFDQGASMWVQGSLISMINRNEIDIVSSNDFLNLFDLSKTIYERSSGAFDPTIGQLVNAWGFGFKDRMEVDQNIVDSLLLFTGFNKVKLSDGKISKSDPRIQFDFNAIAQGYSVDQIARFLEEKGIRNYLVDIGGEMFARGQKADGSKWKVGIEKPSDNAGYGENLKAIIELQDKAIATSGNYRKFYIKDGVRYSHTIDPKTGYPVRHSILSVSVIADNTALADAWATVFMVNGLDNSIEILANDKSLDAYFIYSGSTSGEYKTFVTEGFKKYLVEEME
jgi:thiamine biosynthesis lipoprotein